MKTKLLFLTCILTFNLYSQIPNTLTKSEKLYGLSRFWQEVNYNFVYIDKVDKKAWDEYYKKLLVSIQETENDFEYYQELRKFSAKLKDGHTDVYPPRSIFDMLGFRCFDGIILELENIENKVVVSKVSLDKKNEIPVGTEIVSVNGLSASEYLEKNVKPYFSSSTDYFLADIATHYLFLSPIGTEYKVGLVKPDGTTENTTLKVSAPFDTEIYPVQKERELLEFHWEKQGVAYLALNSFANKKIDSLFLEILPEIRNAKRLIIDLRDNGGGDTETGTAILKYFVSDSVLYGAKSQTRIHIPVYKAWGFWPFTSDTTSNTYSDKCQACKDSNRYELPYYPLHIKSDSEQIIVPTVILTSHRTGSAAEDFLIYAENQKHIIRIGEPTSGSTGQPYMFDMPGGGMARVCAKRDYYPDGRDFVGVGILPDIEVKRTLEDFLSEKDKALQTAIEYLIKK